MQKDWEGSLAPADLADADVTEQTEVFAVAAPGVAVVAEVQSEQPVGGVRGSGGSAVRADHVGGEFIKVDPDSDAIGFSLRASYRGAGDAVTYLADGSGCRPEPPEQPGRRGGGGRLRRRHPRRCGSDHRLNGRGLVE